MKSEVAENNLDESKNYVLSLNKVHMKAQHTTVIRCDNRSLRNQWARPNQSD